MSGQINIVIVDDEKSVCISLSEYFSDNGYKTTYCLSAEHALKHIKKLTPEIIIVDIRLPGIDGTNFIIKAYEINPNIKYLIHTGSISFTLPDSLEKLGLTTEHVIKKPVRNLDIFIEKIEMLLKNI